MKGAGDPNLSGHLGPGPTLNSMGYRRQSMARGTCHVPKRVSDVSGSSVGTAGPIRTERAPLDSYQRRDDDAALKWSIGATCHVPKCDLPIVPLYSELAM